MLHRHPNGDYYEIHEIFSGPNPLNKKKGIGWTRDGIVPHGETPKELIESLRMMLDDAQHCPIFDHETGKKVRRNKNEKEQRKLQSRRSRSKK
jgi:hypothetical protein